MLVCRILAQLLGQAPPHVGTSTEQHGTSWVAGMSLGNETFSEPSLSTTSPVISETLWRLSKANQRGLDLQ
jgi:hypothetical protein